MTSLGGIHNEGVLFSFNPATDVLDTLHSLTGNSNTGPSGNVIQGPNGKLYGMTQRGGSHGLGVIYSYDTTAGTYADLFSFDGTATSGNSPYGSLLLANDGNMYGMCYEGGNGGGYGALFRFNPNTNVYTNMFGFDYFHGEYPYGSLIQAANGKLYGTVQQGGSIGQGVIFSYNIPDSTLTTLHSFITSDGSQPNADLVEVSGILYGMTTLGGAYGKGMLFSIDTAGTTFDTLMSFDGAAHGSSPHGSLLPFNGKLYGMTTEGGTYTGGVIFAWDIALGQFDTLRNMNITTDGNYPYYSSFILVNDNATAVNNPVAMASGITVYPNPASTTLNIHSQLTIDNSQLIITDVLGNEVYHEMLLSNVNYQLSIVNCQLE